MRTDAVVFALVLAGGCAHVEGGGAEPSHARSLPPECGEALGLADAELVLTYEERADLAALDESCARAYALWTRGGPTCAAPLLEAAAIARTRAVALARDAAAAREEGLVEPALVAADGIHAQRLAIDAAREACRGTPEPSR